MASPCAIVVIPISAEPGVTLSSAGPITAETAASVVFRMDVLYAFAPVLDTMVHSVNVQSAVRGTAKMEEFAVFRVEYPYVIAQAPTMMGSTARIPSAYQVTARMEVVAL